MAPSKSPMRHTTFALALEEVFVQRGIGVLVGQSLNPMLVEKYLDTYLLQNKRSLNLLRLAHNLEIPRRVFDATNQDAREQADTLVRCKQLLIDNYGIAEDVAEEFIGAFDLAFHWPPVAGAREQRAREQYDIGMGYFDGNGVPQSYPKAIKHLRMAAELGLAKAQSRLGYCYYLGLGTEQNYYEAAAWYTLAAEKGDPQAQFNLGCCYEAGHGVRKSLNDDDAPKWFGAAARQGYVDTQFHLKDFCFGQSDKPANHADIEEWYRLATEQGDAAAQYNLGRCYHRQSYSRAKAAKWFRLAAEQGHVEAQYRLGSYYENDSYIFGYGFDYDVGTDPEATENAMKWYLLAAEQGHAEAQYCLGRCYFHQNTGWEFRRESPEEVKWFERAAEQGHEGAQDLLISIYHQPAEKWHREVAAPVTDPTAQMLATVHSDDW